VISRYWRKRDHAAVIIAPLMIGEAALGVLRLDRQGGTAPDTDDPTELLEAFANEAALALQRVELAEQAARSQALAEAGEVKTALMMSISHDLKTPLATIKTSVSSLLDHSVPWTEEDREAFLETIDSQADYLNRAISEILDWNRVETGMVRPLLKQVLAADLLADAIERTGPSMRGRNVSIEADSGLALELDPSLVVQALVNLLENADKYSDPGGEVRLRTYRDQGRGVLSVEDQGPGIAADDLPHIFERFYRSRREGTRARGSGLGLALVKAFVELSGGTVEVESSSSGSTFRLVFPALAPTERRSA
jgi:two-component system sensor histidine kinase KdpD